MTQEQIAAWKREKRLQRQGKQTKKEKAALKSESTVPSNQGVPEGFEEEARTQNCGKQAAPVLSK